ncbi:glutamate racemase [Kushneria phosphatilytica]|uniref:Glutamate racemase n=1 Tax=Kushneria phosphatilytica TaxID=657387 RepID=A0A1S1NN04_9GAMM|nr:glutamate racemase [Kushneria phosphatilytica]OHV08697.1 glutamate racemase [Kushneria phosphatilytica]QEL12416.1 glutamate racemase [Kushneria phosphatilytica]
MPRIFVNQHRANAEMASGEVGQASTVLMIDSGVGGLTIAEAIQRRCPALPLLYVADNAWFPYGELSRDALIVRMLSLVAQVQAAQSLRAIVIACNTASTVVLDALRERVACPVIGVVPAIRTAAQLTRSGVIGLLATPGTTQGPYVDTLIARFAAHCRVIRVGARHLAGVAEAAMRGVAPDTALLAAELAPLQQARAAGLDTVVLGCTHYPLLAEAIRGQLGPVQLVDTAEPVARRLAMLLDIDSSSEPVRPVHRFQLTAKRSDNAALTPLLRRRGFTLIDPLTD